MSQNEIVQLIPRDLPLESGRRLRFEFLIAYEITLDEDWLPDGPESLDEIERGLAGSHPVSEQLYRGVVSWGDRDVVEHSVILADAAFSIDDGRPRFEAEWERRERHAGQAETWARSRVWLDAIPAPSAGASA